MVVKVGPLVLVAMACAACAAETSAVGTLPAVPLAGSGAALDARELAAQASFTALVFFSPDCHCLAAHDGRLIALAKEIAPRGARLYAIDSEVRASTERDAEEARRRGYPFPILLDAGGHLARALGAQYATYSVVVDREGRIRYRGGIDSDKMHLHDDAVLYLEDALGDLLSGRDPRTAETKSLGCALQLW